MVAVADPVAAKRESLAGRLGARGVASLGEVLEEGVDAISVCTPTPTHRALATEALASGAHVLCEKPIALTLEDADAIIEAAAAAAGLLMIGHVSRFEPEHRRAQQLVAAGHLGDLHLSSQSITAAAPTWSEGAWLFDIDQSGGPIVDLAIHSFDYLTWLHQSEPVRVTALAPTRRSARPPTPSSRCASPTGRSATVETSWAHPVAHGFHLVTEIAGSGGRLSWTYDDVCLGTMVAVRRHHHAASTRWAIAGSAAEIAAFTAAIRDGDPPPVTAQEGRVALRTALAAHESVRSGRPVEIEPSAA